MERGATFEAIFRTQTRRTDSATDAKCGAWCQPVVIRGMSVGFHSTIGLGIVSNKLEDLLCCTSHKGERDQRDTASTRIILINAEAMRHAGHRSCLPWQLWADQCP